MFVESVIPSYHLFLCQTLLILLSIFPSHRIFSNKSVLCIRWPIYWSFSFSISPSNEYSGLISFKIDWSDLLGWTPIQYDGVLIVRGKYGYRDTQRRKTTQRHRVTESPSQEVRRRPDFPSQPSEDSNPANTRPSASSLQNCESVNFSQSMVLCYGFPRKCIPLHSRKVQGV